MFRYRAMTQRSIALGEEAALSRPPWPSVRARYWWPSGSFATRCADRGERILDAMMQPARTSFATCRRLRTPWRRCQLGKQAAKFPEKLRLSPIPYLDTTDHP
jgi:hypothetical protein